MKHVKHFTYNFLGNYLLKHKRTTAAIQQYKLHRSISKDKRETIHNKESAGEINKS